MYEFYVHELEVRESLGEALERGSGGTEKLVEIVYQPQAKFRVQSVTHCTSSIPGREVGSLGQWKPLNNGHFWDEHLTII